MKTLVVVLTVLITIAAFVSKWTEGNLEWLLGYIKGEAVDVPYWLAFVLTFFTNVFGIGFNLICELLKIVL